MNQKNSILQSMLLHLAEEAAPPREIDLWPTVRARLAQSKTCARYKEPSMKTNFARSRRVYLAAALLFLLAVLLFVATPQGKAFAQSVLRFFTRTSGNELILPTRVPPTLIGVTPGARQPAVIPTEAPHAAFTDICGDLPDPRCSLEQIRGLVDFPVKALASLPEGD